MKKKKSGYKIFGYALHIKRNTTDKQFERVGFLFGTSLEASKYREDRFPDVSRWSVNAVRLNTSSEEVKSS